MATVVICSDEFGPLGRAESEVLGLAGMPLVPIPHPLADNLDDLVAAKAAGIVDDVVAALTGDTDAVRAEHAQRFVRLTQRRLEGGAVCIDDVCAIDFALDPSAVPGG
ncbi:MAG: hypothetical protein P8N02_19240 [Actinomycetota bacterium]|nr:hypothetical protein [Actinomycetota bacterium]